MTRARASLGALRLWARAHTHTPASTSGRPWDDLDIFLGLIELLTFIRCLLLAAPTFNTLFRYLSSSLFSRSLDQVLGVIENWTGLEHFLGHLSRTKDLHYGMLQLIGPGAGILCSFCQAIGMFERDFVRILNCFGVFLSSLGPNSLVRALSVDAPSIYRVDRYNSL